MTVECRAQGCEVVVWVLGTLYSPRPYHEDLPNLSWVPPLWHYPQLWLEPALSAGWREMNLIGILPCLLTLGYTYPLCSSLFSEPHLRVTRLCIKCVSDISKHIWDYHVYFLICLIPRCPVSVRCRDWRLSCWYSIGFNISTLLRSFGLV